MASNRLVFVQFLGSVQDLVAVYKMPPRYCSLLLPELAIVEDASKRNNSQRKRMSNVLKAICVTCTWVREET